MVPFHDPEGIVEASVEGIVEKSFLSVPTFVARTGGTVLQQRHLHPDISVIVARLVLHLRDPESYKQILAYRGTRA